MKFFFPFHPQIGLLFKPKYIVESIFENNPLSSGKAIKHICHRLCGIKSSLNYLNLFFWLTLNVAFMEKYLSVEKKINKLNGKLSKMSMEFKCIK